MRMLPTSVIVTLALFALIVSPAVIQRTEASVAGFASDSVGSIRITVRDSSTGMPVRATAAVSDTTSRSIRAVAIKSGRADLRLAAGRNDLTLAAEGYRAIDTFATLDAGTLDMTVWLDPAVPAPVDEAPLAGQTVIHGNVIDLINMVPLAGARVSLKNSAAFALTDENGHFSLSTIAPPVDPIGDVPGTDDLEVEYGGEIIYRRNGVLLAEGSTHLIVDVDPAAEMTETADTHKLMESRKAVIRGETDPVTPPGSTQDIEAKGPPAPVDDSPHAKAPTAPLLVTVPANIRVGFNCPTKSTCSTVQVFTLDTYTRLGLDDEWFSSWNTNSLKAGAIANRTYGVWHIANPLNPNYDICNTTSCQVIDPNDSAASSDLATAQTTGSIVVTSSGTAPFFAEYSAENNLGGCPDGFTGNNGSWPCLADPVDAGRAFNGHGRGMCQWGTQNWSIQQGKDFVWIVNHYYNANGNPSGLRTGVLQSSPNSVLPPPELTTPAAAEAPGVQINTLTPQITWQPVTGSDGFGLYISKFNGTTYDLIYNSETAVGQPLTGSSFTLPAGLLQQNGQYRWNMSTHNAGGYGSSNTFRGYFFVNVPITVSGRVIGADGRPLRGTTVSLIDSTGAVTSALTSSLGFYSFENVTAGQIYILKASSKRYRFTSQTITVTDSISNADFEGVE